jgi:hypothetical protein
LGEFDDTMVWYEDDEYQMGCGRTYAKNSWFVGELIFRWINLKFMQWQNWVPWAKSPWNNHSNFKQDDGSLRAISLSLHEHEEQWVKHASQKTIVSELSDSIVEGSNLDISAREESIDSQTSFLSKLISVLKYVSFTWSQSFLILLLSLNEKS